MHYYSNKIAFTKSYIYILLVKTDKQVINNLDFIPNISSTRHFYEQVIIA